MIRKRFIKRRQPTIFIKANHQIRFPQVRVLTEFGEMLGIMPVHEALSQAQAAGKDLVLVTEKAEPPITKIIDLAKHKYQVQQKESENRKKSRSQDLKEVQFTPFIGEGDFQTKLRRIVEFLTRGDKVRISIEFRNPRQMAKKEFGYEIIRNVISATAEIGVVEVQPQFQGKKLVAQLMPGKKKVKSESAKPAEAKPEAKTEPETEQPDTASDNQVTK